MSTIMNPQKIDGSLVLLKSSWSLFKTHWQTLTIIAIIPIVVNYISTLLINSHQLGLAIIGTILGLIAAILSVAMTAGLIKTIQTVSNEAVSNLSVISQYRIGFTFFWSLVLVSILGGLTTMGSFLMFVIPGIIVGVYIAFYSFACIVDGKKGLSALLESYSIVHGRWKEVFVRLFNFALITFFVYIIVILLNLAVSYFAGVDLAALAKTQQTIPVSVSLAGFVFNLLSQAIIGPFAIIYSYKLYQSLKATRQSDVSTTVFKRWSIAFMIIVPVSFILLFVMLVSTIAIK